MRFESEKSMGMRVGMYVLCLFTIAVGALYCVFFDTVLKYVIAALCLIVAALLVWVRLCTYYELRDDCLYLRSGPFRDEIPYDEIKTVDKTRGWNFIMALGFDRLQINAGINPEKGKTVLSPENEDEFLRELSLRCPELEIRE